LITNFNHHAKITRERAKSTEVLADKGIKIIAEVTEEGKVGDDFLKKYQRTKQSLDRLKNVRGEDFRDKE
jgi:hypothetical protein